jgi:putative methionine-R-sulfoxide reductase with GAF domain
MPGENDMTFLEKKLSAEQRTQRFAFRFSLIMFGATSIVTAVYYYLAIQLNVPQMYTAAYLLTFFFFITFIGAVLSRRGKPEAGMWLIFLTMMIVWTYSSTLIAGLGIAMGLSLPLLITQMASHVFPPKRVLQATIGSFIAGAATLLIDIFGPNTRLVVPALERFIPMMAIITVAIFGIIVIKQFPQYKLRTKLIFTTGVVASLAVIAVAFFAINTTQTELEVQVGNNLNRLAEAQALAVGELMTRQIDTLKALGLNKFIRDAVSARNGSALFQGASEAETEAITAQFNEQWQDADDLDPLVLNVLNNTTSRELTTFRESFPRHVELILTDKQGRLIASTERPEKFTYVDEDWWITAYGIGFGQTYIGVPFFDEEKEIIVVDIAVPVKVIDGAGASSIGGVLLTRFNMDSIATVLSAGHFGETGQIELHFPDHTKIQLDVNETAALSKISLQEFQPEEIMVVEQLIASGESMVRTVYQGEQSAVSQATVTSLSTDRAINRSGWLMVAYQPEVEAFAPVQKLIQTNILAGILVVLVAVGIAAAVGQFFAKPIVEMTNVAAKVAEGDLSARVLIKNADEIGALGESFNQMTEQLSEAITGLETRVSERTKALEASAEVSRSLSTILEQDKLIAEVAEQVRSSFNYYHAHIYLLDKNSKTLILSASTGEAGATMLAAGHAIPKDRGLVGRAATLNQAVLIPDVSQAEDWLPNLLLPDTKAEAAVPIAIGNEVLGVLDVQDNEVGSLNQDTMGLLQSIANQLALALQNAKSYEAAKQKAARETVINEIRQKITSATEVESAMQIAVRELGTVLGARRTAVKLTVHAEENGQE